MKRFTDTGKWAKAWFQDLPPHLKCLWLYLCDAADAAGVWDTNWKLASAFIGHAVGESDMAAFGERVQKLADGKFAIVPFIEFQYGKLSKECKAHVPIFRAIEKHRLSIGVPKATDSLQEAETDKEKEEGSAEGRDGTPSPAVASAPVTVAQVKVWASVFPTLPKPDDGFCEWWWEEQEKRGWTDPKTFRPWHNAKAAFNSAWRGAVHGRQERDARHGSRAPASATRPPAPLPTARERHGTSQ